MARGSTNAGAAKAGPSSSGRAISTRDGFYGPNTATSTTPTHGNKATTLSNMSDVCRLSQLGLGPSTDVHPASASRSSSALPPPPGTADSPTAALLKSLKLNYRIDASAFALVAWSPTGRPCIIISDSVPGESRCSVDHVLRQIGPITPHSPAPQQPYLPHISSSTEPAETATPIHCIAEAGTESGCESSAIHSQADPSQPFFQAGTKRRRSETSLQSNLITDKCPPADDDDDDSDVDENIEAISHQVTLSVGDRSATRDFYKKRLALMQQLSLKVILKAWIKAVEPQKQTHFPYVGSKDQAKGKKLQRRKKRNDDAVTGIDMPAEPPWWPPTTQVRHIEPDHIVKKERITLAIHMLQYRNKQRPITVGMLRRSTDNIILRFPNDGEVGEAKEKWRREILDSIYMVAEAEEAVAKGERDANQRINMAAVPRFVSGIKRARKANAPTETVSRRNSKVDGEAKQEPEPKAAAESAASEASPSVTSSAASPIEETPVENIQPSARTPGKSSKRSQVQNFGTTVNTSNVSEGSDRRGSRQHDANNQDHTTIAPAASAPMDIVSSTNPGHVPTSADQFSPATAEPNMSQMYPIYSSMTQPQSAFSDYDSKVVPEPYRDGTVPSYSASQASDMSTSYSFIPPGGWQSTPGSSSMDSTFTGMNQPYMTTVPLMPHSPMGDCGPYSSFYSVPMVQGMSQPLKTMNENYDTDMTGVAMSYRFPPSSNMGLQSTYGDLSAQMVTMPTTTSMCSPTTFTNLPGPGHQNTNLHAPFGEQYPNTPMAVPHGLPQVYDECQQF